MIEWLNIKLNFNKSLKEIKQKEFEKNLILCKKNIHLNFPKYTQVFNYKNGFLENLNILDLIFNLGPESSSYLKNLPTSNNILFLHRKRCFELSALEPTKNPEETRKPLCSGCI